MRSVVSAIVALVAVFIIAEWSPLVGTDETASETDSFDVDRIHPDPEALMAAFLDATRAVVIGDNKGLRAALDRVQNRCARISDLDTVNYSARIKNIDKAFHTSVDVARELAGDGKTRQAYEQYLWVERGCWMCHSSARSEGLMPTQAVDAVPEGESPN